MLIIDFQFIPLEPRRLFLCYSPLQLIFSGAYDCLRQLLAKKETKNHVRYVCYAKNRLYYAKTQELTVCTVA